MRAVSGERQTLRTVPSGETEIGADQAELEALTVELKDALVPNL